MNGGVRPKCSDNGLVSKKKHIIFFHNFGRKWGESQTNYGIFHNFFFFNEGFPKQMSILDDINTNQQKIHQLMGTMKANG